MSRLVLLAALACAALCPFAAGFVVPGARSSRIILNAAAKPSIDVEKLLTTIEKQQLLSKISALGLLSKAEKAGIKLSTLEPLLVFADEADILGLIEATSDDLLPLLPKLVETAPALLPIAGAALNTPPAALYGLAVASLAGAAAVITAVPDDSLVNVALQTFAAVPLVAVVPVASLVGATILSKIKA